MEAVCPPPSFWTFRRLCRGVVPGGAGDAMTPPDFGRQLTLSQPGGADYAHHITTGTPGFSDLPMAQLCIAYLGKQTTDLHWMRRAYFLSKFMYLIL